MQDSITIRVVGGENLEVPSWAIALLRQTTAPSSCALPLLAQVWGATAAVAALRLRAATLQRRDRRGLQALAPLLADWMAMGMPTPFAAWLEDRKDSLSRDAIDAALGAASSGNPEDRDRALEALAEQAIGLPGIAEQAAGSLAPPRPRLKLDLRGMLLVLRLMARPTLNVGFVVACLVVAGIAVGYYQLRTATPAAAEPIPTSTPAPKAQPQSAGPAPAAASLPEEHPNPDFHPPSKP